MAQNNNHTLLYVGLAGAAVLGFAYWKSQQAAAATASTTTTTTTTNVPTSTVNPADAANIALISGWVNSMTPGSTQNYWQGVLASASSSTLAMWAQCLQVFGTKGAVLNQTQQAFWNNLAQGH
jgi:hypothetical protein